MDPLNIAIAVLVSGFGLCVWVADAWGAYLLWRLYKEDRRLGKTVDERDSRKGTPWSRRS